MIEENGTGSTVEQDDFATETQAGKTFTQEDVDKFVRERLDRERKKFSKQFEGVDVEKYRSLMEKEEKLQMEQHAARGEFEKVLQTTVQKKDTQIQELQKQLQTIKVDGTLLSAASANKAVNPNQVVRLLKDQIRLNNTGEVEIVDDTGSVRYTDSGSAMGVEDLVSEFLQHNPHFVSAGPSGSGSQGSVASAAGSATGKVDISKLDMSKAQDRALFREMTKSNKR